MGAPNNQEYHKASNAVLFGGFITFIAGFLFMMSFTSPYWMESYDYTFTAFKHMGLWEYCFEQFRYPYYQLDKLFDGCHHVFSNEYHVIREWLIPPWLMVVQAFCTLALLLSFTGQALIALIIVRWPLKFVLQYEWMLSSVAFVTNLATAGLLFLSVAIFGGECYRRDWLMYPNYNHLSWSYGLAVISFFLHALGAFFLYLDAQAGFMRRRQSRNLVLQMQPDPHSHHAHRMGYI